MCHLTTPEFNQISRIDLGVRVHLWDEATGYERETNNVADHQEAPTGPGFCLPCRLEAGCSDGGKDVEMLKKWQRQNHHFISCCRTLIPEVLS